MMDIWDVIKNDIRNMSIQTELLEACGWDEDEMSSSILVFQSVLNSLNVEELNQNTIFISVKKSLEDKLDFQKSNIFMKMLSNQKEELIEYMKLSEN